MSWRKVDLLDVRVAGIDRTRLVEQVLAWAREGERRTITYVNAACIALATESPTYRTLLNQADLVYVDGIGIVWAGRLFGFRGLYKVTGRDWIDEFCRLSEASHLRLYLLAGKPGIAERARQVLENRYPGLVVSGTADGYFQAKTEDQVLTEMSNDPPHVLLIGMGVPAQENWVFKHQEQIPAIVCWCVGALFDVVAGVEQPVPQWLEKLGFEWLWRLKEDPRGKWRRYLVGIPRFVWAVIRSRLERK